MQPLVENTVDPNQCVDLTPPKMCPLFNGQSALKGFSNLQSGSREGRSTEWIPPRIQLEPEYSGGVVSMLNSKGGMRLNAFHRSKINHMMSRGKVNESATSASFWLCCQGNRHHTVVHEVWSLFVARTCVSLLVSSPGVFRSLPTERLQVEDVLQGQTANNRQQILALLERHQTQQQTRAGGCTCFQVLDVTNSRT